MTLLMMLKNTNKIIQKLLPNIPENPGIYKMIDDHGKIIYIGKAKNIKARLYSYTLKLERKNQAMINQLASIEYHVTNSESDALLLESQLIKRFQPKYNILLKDDKSFPYIKLRLNHDYPQILKYRGKELQGGEFFGPFTSVKQLEITLKELQKTFKLRSCSDQYFSNRTRPCIQYEIKRCSAPCVNKISKQEYADSVKFIKMFFRGKAQNLQALLTKKMKLLSDQMQFEQAAQIRDRIHAISNIQLKSLSIAGSKNTILKEIDVIALYSNTHSHAISVSIYRENQFCGDHYYFPENINPHDTMSDILQSFIMQLYQNKIPPACIMTNYLVEHQEDCIKALDSLYNKKIKILTINSVENHQTQNLDNAQSQHLSNQSSSALGQKNLSKNDLDCYISMMQNALYNVELALNREMQSISKHLEFLTEMQKLFALPTLPNRIEIFDNSHLQGTRAFGGMVVFGKQGFAKKEYRLFRIKSLENIPDDYSMLKEVLSRRIKRFDSDISSKIPDILIIDGGAGHLSTASEVMKNSKIKIPILCISKGKSRIAGQESFHIENKKSFKLDPNSHLMKYLQILRDEAHNFAITSHRKSRDKLIKTSILDNISNVGQIRKYALLGHFGSVENLAQSSISEIQKVQGINLKLAQAIHKALN